MPNREQTNVMLDRGLIADLHAEAEAEGISYRDYVERILQERHHGLTPDKQRDLDELRRLMADSEPRARKFNLLLHRLLDKSPVVAAASAAVIALAFPIGSYALFWHDPDGDEADDVVSASEDANAAPCHHEARWKRSIPCALSGPRSTNTASSAASASRPSIPKTAGRTPKAGTSARPATLKKKPSATPSPSSSSGATTKPAPPSKASAAESSPAVVSAPSSSSFTGELKSSPPIAPSASKAPKEHPVHPVHPEHPPHPPKPEQEDKKDKS